MKRIAILALGVAFLATSASFAADTSKTTQFTLALASVPTAELPAKAAGLVKDAKATEREAATISIVKAAVSLNPAAAPVIVGTIAKSSPEMAAVAAGAAATEQPKQASAIARAAAAAAPSYAGKIVAAVCRAVPNDYRNVAIAVSQVAPGSEKEILSGVAEAVPNLKPYIEKTLVGFAGSTPAVTTVLDSPKTSSDLLSYRVPPAPLARGPAVGPPYIPLSSTPTNVIPGNSGEVPPGGRDYASP